MAIGSVKEREEMRRLLRKEVDERKTQEEAERLSLSLSDFVKAAWPHVKKNEQYRHNWHLDAINLHLEAVSAGEIHRLQIWVPPGSMKSLSVSVFWHAWEWTTRPWVRYWSASYETRLAGRLSAMARDLMLEAWYQERWGADFLFNRDAEHYYGNNQGGTRLATSPESSGTGEHGHRIIIDDPINAKDADATSKSTLDSVNDWFDGTVPSRGLDGVLTPDGTEIDHARVIIMQRLHEDDLAAHALEIEDWVVLCIPERYYSGHPYAYRGQAGRVSADDLGSTLGPGDPRIHEDELLWPERRSERASDALAKQLKHRAAGQLQQMPAPKEGQSILRSWWRFYPPNLFNDANRRPHCTMVVQSIDCPLKDKQTNDMVSIQAWGVKGADRYLIDIRTSHMSYTQAKRAVIEQARYVRAMYPRGCRHKILIENGGYGPDLITDLKRILTGVEKIPVGQDGDKEIRADSAADDLQSGNCWLPGVGAGADITLGPAGTVSNDIHDFIESCAVFPHGKHDDDVDAWSQAMNWLRSQVLVRGKTGSAFKRAARTVRQAA